MASGRTIREACLRLCGLALLMAALAAPRLALADPITSDLQVKTSDGYARLIFSMSDFDDGSVRLDNNILIISFKQPLDVSVDRLPMQAPDYIGAARRDPDGKAIRIGLARKVTINAMPAGEKLFVDLLPDTWTGEPPGLPQEVVEDLARRARMAERLAKKERQQQETQQKEAPPVRVHVAIQPTFTRYIFDVTDQTSVSVNRSKDKVTVSFDQPLKFDLGDAAATLPRTIGSIDAKQDGNAASVSFNLLRKVDVRSFRDENGYVIDVMDVDANIAQGGPAPMAKAPNDGAAAAAEKLNIAPPATIAAQGAPNVPAASPAPKLETVPGVKPPAPPPAQPAMPPAGAAASQNAKAQAAPNAQTVAPSPAQSAAASPAASRPAGPATSPDTKVQADAAAKANSPATAPNVAAPAPNASAIAAPAAPAPAVATPAPAAPATSTPDRPAAHNANTADKIFVELSRQGAELKLSFPFAAPTAAAVFRRADTMWIIFDSKADIDLSALEGENSRTIRNVSLTRAPDADIVRLTLDRPHLSSVAVDGSVWTVQIGDTVLDPTHALDLNRNMIGSNRSSIVIPFDKPHELHRISDPEIGDSLLVVTAFGPARGVINGQNFIELRALASTHGVVVQPLADDVNVELAADKVVISRPGGLTLSSTLQNVLRGNAVHPEMLDSQIWGADRQAPYMDRQAKLISAAAEAPENDRLEPRLDLARFYLARSMYPEAKGVLDVVLADKRPGVDDVSATVLRAISEVMMNRPADALQDLDNPAIGDQHDAPLWRALAFARQGKWTQARAGFKTAEAAMATLPIELQRFALKEQMRSAIEVGDFAGAENNLNDLGTIGVPHDMEPDVAILVGRLAEGLGHNEEALKAYRTAADSWDRPAAAQGKLREIALRYKIGDLKRDDVVSELESLTTVWRGDETEIGALQILARLYTEEGRYRDSFYVMRSAMTAHPDWDMTHKIQEEAAKTFDSLFLSGKGDALPAIDALALFYDFRDLTPAGRRGDEMIRRLADRLVSVDLLDQASDLLQYQVDHRLEGAARAQVAARLAVIYLMNRKADRALAVLRETRAADFSTELRNERLLLEARALSDMGRNDVALEVAAGVSGHEAMRLRSDILWAAGRWREAAEQVELMYGDRWKEWQPLNDVERSDVLRAEIGYALGEDKLGLSRFREKYAAKMAQTPDARAFDIVSAPLGASGAEFKEIAREAASVDTLDNFLRDMKARYPEASPVSPPASPPGASAPGEVSSQQPQAPASSPAEGPTPPSRASGRTALR